MPDFHCNAKYFLITYSQSAGLDEWAVNDHFASLGAECIIAREDHATRGTHLHAFVAFERKFRSRRPDIFDVGGFHPNISPSRGNPGGGYDYAIKDGEVVAGGLERPGGGGVSKTSTPWHWIIAASSPGELRDLVRELAPKEAILRWKEIEGFIGNEFAEERPAYVHPIGQQFELGMVPELDEWRRNTLEADRLDGKSCPSLRGSLLLLPVAWAGAHCRPHLRSRAPFLIYDRSSIQKLSHLRPKSHRKIDMGPFIRQPLLCAG